MPLGFENQIKRRNERYLFTFYKMYTCLISFQQPSHSQISFKLFFFAKVQREYSLMCFLNLSFVINFYLNVLILKTVIQAHTNLILATWSLREICLMLR